jgi:hypothetical protein
MRRVTTFDSFTFDGSILSWAIHWQGPFSAHIVDFERERFVSYMHKMPEYLVVMTASITPAANAETTRRDPRVRLEDYKAALRFWLAQRHSALDRILFLENTGFDLSELRAVARDENPLGKEVEFQSMNATGLPPGMHYGYGEMQMLDEGLTRSYLRQRTTHMIKVTGRLKFPSIGKLLDRLPNQFDVCVECRVPLQSYRSSGIGIFKAIENRVGAYTTCQLMIFSHSFYERELQRLYPELQPTYPGSYPRLIEGLIYERVKLFESQQGVYLRWPLNVEPVGHSGQNNKHYNDPKRALIRVSRAAMRILAPRLWL